MQARATSRSAWRFHDRQGREHANWEFMAHCLTQMPIESIEDQRSMMVQSADIIEKFTGTRPKG